VNVGLAVVAGVAVAGAILAVSARDVRAAVLGVLILLLASPLVATPLPSPAAVLARVAAGLLAARFLTIGLRGESVTAGTRIGWPTEALAAAAAAVVGFGSHGLGAVPLGPVEAQAAGFACIALAIGPLVTARDVLRLGIGALVLVVGAVLVRIGLDGPLGDGGQLVTSLLTVGLGGAVAVIAAAARSAGGLATDAPVERRGPRPPDAHRIVDPVVAAVADVRAPGLPWRRGRVPSLRRPRTPQPPPADAP
jgi:hypothetical protein